MSAGVQVETYDQIVEITIDRPSTNAINPGAFNAIYQALTMLQGAPLTLLKVGR
jgi:enoyl-CoA hydratase/carnithine racemase